MTPAPPERDRGAVLILTLVVVFVLGLTVTAIATYATTSLRAGPVAQSRMEQEAAVEAALVAALDQIRSGAAACLFDDGTVTLDGFDLTINDLVQAQIATTCTAVTSISDVGVTWSAAVTGQGLSSANDPVATSSVTDATFAGSVFMPSLEANALSDITGPAVTIGGPLVSNTCPAPSPGAVAGDIAFAAPLVDRPVCTTLGWTEFPAFHAPPLPSGLATISPAAMPTDVDYGSGTCRVFTPGLYDDDPLSLPPPIPEINATDAYFRSGDYVFDTTSSSTGGWDLHILNGSDVVAGNAPGFVPERVSSWTCGSYPEFTSDAQTGATFYLADRAFVDVRGGTLEIAPRLQSGGTADTQVSVQALCAASSWCAGTSLTPSAHTANPLPGFSSSNRNALRVRASSWLRTHGLVYAPLAQVRLDGDAIDDSALLGGVVAARLSLGADVTIGAFASSTIAPASTTVLIEATVVVDGVTTVMQATADVDLTQLPEDRVTVTGWNLCDPAGC